MEGLKSLQNASVLVTGASGMLGRELVRRLSASNRVTGVSKSGREGSRACDLARAEEVEKIFAEFPPAAVIHAAAFSDVDGCEKEPVRAHEANALAVEHLAKACGKRGVPLVHVSTDYVFDGKKRTPYLETDKTFPVNIYGLTKLAGEHAARRWAKSGAIVRTSWLFGAGNPQNFVNAIAERLKSEKLVRVLEDQEDSPTSAADLSIALSAIAQRAVEAARAKKDFWELFHFCNTGSTTRYEMTLKIRDYLGLKTAVEKLDRKEIKGRLAVRPEYAAMSTEYYRRFFGVSIRRWEESLEDYLK